MKNSFFKKSSASWLGKMSLMVIALLFAGVVNAQNTYFWVGGPGSSGTPGAWTTAANWNTTRGGGGLTRTSPNNGDILVIDASNGGTGTPAATTIYMSAPNNETIQSLILGKGTSATTISFATGTNSLNIQGDLVLSASCTLADGGNTFVVGGTFASANTGTTTVHSGTGGIKMTNAGTATSFCTPVTINTAGTGFSAGTISIGYAWVSGATYSVGNQVVNNGYLYTITSGSTAGTVAPTHLGGAVTATGGTAVYTFAGIAATATCTVTTGGLATITPVTNGGSGYVASSGKIDIKGSSGTLAQVTPLLVNGITLGNSGNMNMGNLEITNQTSTNSIVIGGSTLVLNGNLNLNSTGVLSLNGKTLTLNSTSSTTGNFSGSGTLSGGILSQSGTNGGYVIIQGSGNTANQTINFNTANANSSSINNFTVNRAGATIKVGTCTSNLLQLISGTLFLNNGIFDDGGNVIKITGGTIVSNTSASATSVVYQSSGGKIQAGRTGSSPLTAITTSGSTIKLANVEIVSSGAYTVAVGTTITNSLSFTTAGTGTINGTNLTLGDGTTNPFSLTFSILTSTPSGGFITAAPTYSASPVNLTYTGTCTATGLETTGLGAKLKNLTISLTSGTLVLGSSYTIASGNTLTLTSGAVTNSSTNNITLSDGATISRAAGTLAVAPVFGTSSSHKVAVTITGSVTSGNEILGTPGMVGMLTVNGAVTYTLGTISGNNLSLDGITVNNASGILDAGTNSISENTSVTMTVSNSGTIKTSNTGTTPLPTGKTWGGTVQYASTSGGHIVSATSYNNLKLSNASGSLTNDANLSVLGTLTTTAGGTLALGAFTLSTAAISNGGTISTTSTSTTPIPSGLDYSGASNAGSVQFLGSGAQTIPSATYGAVTLNNTAGVALGGSITIGGTLSFSNGTTVLTVGANTLTLKGAVNITSGVAAGSINASDASATVVYSGGLAQTINNYTYPNPGGVRNLTIANSAG